MAYANTCGNMPCWNKCHFWDRHRARFPEKKSKTWEHIQNDAMLRSGFFPTKRARWRSRVLDFIPGFTDKGQRLCQQNVGAKCHFWKQIPRMRLTRINAVDQEFITFLQKQLQKTNIQIFISVQVRWMILTNEYIQNYQLEHSKMIRKNAMSWSWNHLWFLRIRNFLI